MNNWHKCATKEALFPPPSSSSRLFFLPRATITRASERNPFHLRERGMEACFAGGGEGRGDPPFLLCSENMHLFGGGRARRGEVVKLGNFLSRRRRSGKGGRRISEGAFDKRDRQGEEEKKAEGWNGTLLHPSPSSAVSSLHSWE